MGSVWYLLVLLSQTSRSQGLSPSLSLVIGFGALDVRAPRVVIRGEFLDDQCSNIEPARIKVSNDANREVRDEH